TGVATSNPELVHGLNPTDKRFRVANYHRNTIHAFAEILGSAGLSNSQEISRAHVFRRISNENVKTYAELFPNVTPGAFLRGDIPAAYKADFERATSTRFQRPLDNRLPAA